MKKHLLMLFVVMVATAMSLKAQTIVIDEGFENGIQDSVWTQEFVVGNTPWAVESTSDNLTYPATVKQGTKRAYLRNTTGETQGYVTRLVSKVMDLSPEKVYQPELTFWYANPKWTADRDTLRVLYRTSTNANWKQLAEYSSASATWQKVSMALPEVNETYQIAFEGSDNLGRGIVLDSVKLRSAPECTVPHDLAVNNVGPGKVNIAWSASWDANSFELIVSKDTIDPDTVANVPASVIGYHGTVSGLKQNCDVTLESGEYYYVYIRSVCETEASAWNSEDPTQQGAFYFRVKATKNVPYYCNFNMEYDAGMIHRDLEWTWGNNTGKYNPFIDTHLGETDRAKYSKDATTCVVFSGANNVTTPVPAGSYVYLATPALEDTANANFALNQCQVRFWSTVYTHTGRKFAHSLIVGVMTDPEDVTTFLPIDTVSVYGSSTFVENIVDLSSYNGDAAYVAFASNFDTQNIFFIDDVTIEYKKEVNNVTKISANPRDTYADITWEGNATSYTVLITKEEVNPANPKAGSVVDSAVVTTNTYRCISLEPNKSWNKPYYAYVKAEGADWSYRYPFVTIASETAVPYGFDMEKKTGTYYSIGTVNYPTGIGIFSNDPDYPHLYTSNYYKGSSCLYLTKNPGNDSWITLPMVDSLSNKQIKFYLGGISTTYAQAHATLGVMTNPMDINTFHPVADFTLGATGYTLCYANFVDYDGPEGVIAIVWSDVEGMAKNTINYIDELKVEELAQCLAPVNIQTEATSDSVVVSWDASPASQWEFVLTKSALSATQKDYTFDRIKALSLVHFADTLKWNDPLTVPTFGIDSLSYDTPYYIYVRTICGDNELTWWTEASFRTPCPEAFPYPFKETFEKYTASVKEYPCWQFGEYGTGTGYPMTYKPSSGATSGFMLELWSTSTTHRNVVIMPTVDGNLNNMQLSFDARPYSATGKAVVYVGSMGDIEDWTTFVAIDSFFINGGNEFLKVRMNLADYTLAYNNIAFSSGLGDNLTLASDLLLDNIELKDNNCIEPWDFVQTNETPNSVDFTWKGVSPNDKWEIKVLNKEIKLDSIAVGAYDTAAVAVINDTLVTGKTLHVEGLNPVSTYYVYLRGLCGDSIWMMETIKTACVKLDPTKPNKETFESYTSGTGNKPDCWTSGNANPSASSSYIPYIYNSSTYASSGTKSYYMYGYSTTSSPAYIISPEIDCDNMSELAVAFNIYSSSSYYWLCGVMTDPMDLSTFVVLDSVKGTASKVQYTYDLSEYADSIPATAKYFAWRTPYGVTGSAYLDDVSFSKITCPLTKPSYSNVTSESARISSGLRTENEWLLLVTDKEVNVDSLSIETYVVPDTVIVFFDTIDARSKTVTNLKEQTMYYVYTASVCDSVISTWNTVSFLTPCKPVTPEAMGTITFATKDGYVTGSSASRYLPCWTIGNKSGNAGPTSSYIPYVTAGSATSAYSRNGNNYLYMYAYVPSSTSSTPYDGAYAIMPELDIDSIKNYQVNFWARTTSSTGANYNDQLIIGVVTDPADINTFAVIDTLTLSHTSYEPFTVSFEEYEGDFLGNYGKYIMFLAEAGSHLYDYAYISEISVEAIPACRPVQEFVVDSITEEAFVVSLNGYSESYRLLLADEVVPDSVKATYKWLQDTVVNHADSILISGLKPATKYYLYAQGFCGASDTSAISMLYEEITTECPLTTGYPVPLKEDFETCTGTVYEWTCWDLIEFGTSTTYPRTYKPTSGATSGWMLELWTSGTTYRNVAVMPKVQGDLSNYVLSFDTRPYSATGTATLYVGTIGDVNNDSTFVAFDTINITTGAEFTHKSYTLADYNLPYDRIAFSSGLEPNVSSDVCIDNVRIGFPPSCYAPTLEAGSTTINTAEVLITPAKEANNKWELAIVPDSVYSKTGFDAAEYLDSLENPILVDTVDYIITGLDTASVYYIYARTVCGGEDGESEWTSKPIKVRTNLYYKDSYYFGFEKSEGWDRSPYSTSDTYYLHPGLVSGRDTLAEYSTSYSYYPYAQENTTSYIYAYGPKDGSLGKGALKMYAYTYSYDYYGHYVIFPAVEEAHDRSFEFKARPGYLTASSMKPSTTYDAILEVGLVDKNKGFENYEILTTIKLDKLNTADTAKASNNYLYKNYTLDLDSATIANKQVVLHMPKQPGTTSYIFVDEVALDSAKGFGLVGLDKVSAESNKATVSWVNFGGPWNLYITKQNKTKVDTVAQYLNLTDTTSQIVTGLQPKTTYTAILVAANAPDSTNYLVSDTETFTTTCEVMQANSNGEFFWNFDDPDEWELNDIVASASDTAYKKPACFTVGSTYEGSHNGYQWLLQQKGYDYYSTLGTYMSTSYQHYEIGRDDSQGALRIFTSSTYHNTTNLKQYIVLPELNCNFDTMMIEFWGRCFVNYDESYTTEASRGKIYSVSYLGSSYSQSMVIGTLTDPHDFSTLQVLDTVSYKQTGLKATDNVNDDPTGNRYWEKMQVPLKGAKGKYIVLFQPAYGLFILDDLSVKPVGNTLFAPTGAHNVEVTDSSAVVEWVVKHPTLPSVVVLNNDTVELMRDTLVGTEYTFTNLEAATSYSWYVYQTDGTNETDKTPYVTIITECKPVTPAYTCGFEEEEGWMIIPGQTSETYKQTLCWTYSDANYGRWYSSSYNAYNKQNTSSYNYSRTGDYALMIDVSSTYASYVAMPAMDTAAYDTLQLSFWMRPGYASATTGKISTVHSGSKSVIVGTMTDPNDATTFVPLDTMTYEGSIASGDVVNEANNFLFQQMKVDLRGAAGQYVAIFGAMVDKSGKTYSSGWLYMDDFSFVLRTECKEPKALLASEIGAYTAELSWQGPDSVAFLLQVSTDADFAVDTAFVFNDTVYTTFFDLDSLQSATKYTWRVMTICGGELGESEFSQKASFTTAIAPYFLENFAEPDLAGDWWFSTTHVANVLDDSTAVLSVTSSNSSTWGFKRTTTGYGLRGPHYACSGYLSDYHWMITPSLYIPENDSVHFTVDVALTANASGNSSPSQDPVTEANMKDDYTILIIVSEDGGQTWASENILALWNNKLPAGQQLRDIPATGESLRFALGKYAGKNVRIGFYREAISSSSVGISFHVGNIRFGYFDKVVESASGCQYEDIDLGDIHLDGDVTEPGVMTYAKYQLASDLDAKAGARDTIQVYEIEIFEAPETIIAGTICEGDTYTDANFSGKEREGVYRKKMQTVEHGCDSIVTLYLTVTPRAYAEDNIQTVCPGETYTWNGKVYNRAGVYRDTTVSVAGCDSIETLVLSFYENEDTITGFSRIAQDSLPFTYADEEHPYIVGQAPIYYPAGTPVGNYMDTVLVQGTNCTAVLIHTLAIYDSHEGYEIVEEDANGARKVIYRGTMYIIKNDEWYNALGQKVADPRD